MDAAKQKAKELYEACYYELPSHLPERSKDFMAKQFAGLIITEVQNQAKNWGVVSTKVYWQNVRAELNNI